MRIVIVTGGFDPLHSGHISYFYKARSLGDLLIVGLNSDSWLVRKKGMPFLNWSERYEIIKSLRMVTDVISFNDEDDTGKDAIKILREKYPRAKLIFANGGDRNSENTSEQEIEDKNLSFAFGVGGNFKKNSSSWILDKWKNFCMTEHFKETSNDFIKITPVEGHHDLQSVRRIRNECKHFMTRYNKDITEEEQTKWFSSLDHNKNWLFVVNKFLHGVASSVIGYGYNRIEGDSILLTGGLVETERGKEHGRALFSFLLEHAKTLNIPVKLEVLKNNVPAIKLYRSLGFVEIEKNDLIIKMEYKNDSAV